MKEKVIAIDIVLIPDNEITDICKKINISCNSKIDFTNTKKIPHISLLMGMIEISKLEEIKKIISNINFGTFDLEGKIENYLIEETGENILSLNLEKKLELNNLFDELQNKIKPILNYSKIDKNMFFEGNNIEKVFLDYVLGYKNINTKNFSAHITLGIECGKKYLGKSFNFTASKIGLFQLGNYCTCSNNKI